MTKWLQDLMLLHRIVAVIHFLQGLFMLFGGKFFLNNMDGITP